MPKTGNTPKQYFEVVPLSSGELPPNDGNHTGCSITFYVITPHGIEKAFYDFEENCWCRERNGTPLVVTAWLRPTDLTTIIKDAASKAWDAALHYELIHPAADHPNKKEYINSLTQ